MIDMQITVEPALYMQLQNAEIEKLRARIAELEAENAKFRAMYDEQLLMAVKVSAALEKK